MFNVVNVVNDGSSLLKTRPPINGWPIIGTDPVKCICSAEYFKRWINVMEAFDSSRRRRARAFLSPLPVEEQPKFHSADTRSKLQKLFFLAH